MGINIQNTTTITARLKTIEIPTGPRIIAVANTP